MFEVIRLQVLTPSPMVLATISFMEVQERRRDTCLHCSVNIRTCTDGQMFSTETICGASAPSYSDLRGPTGLIYFFCRKSLQGLWQ